LIKDGSEICNEEMITRERERERIKERKKERKSSG
jgi:hypothetical protein